MSKNSLKFIDQLSDDFKKKIRYCYVTFALVLESYDNYVQAGPQQDVQSPAEFLRQHGSWLEEALRNKKCYEEALEVMRGYVKK